MATILPSLEEATLYPRPIRSSMSRRSVDPGVPIDMGLPSSVHWLEASRFLCPSEERGAVNFAVACSEEKSSDMAATMLGKKNFILSL